MNNKSPSQASFLDVPVIINKAQYHYSDIYYFLLLQKKGIVLYKCI